MGRREERLKFHERCDTPDFRATSNGFVTSTNRAGIEVDTGRAVLQDGTTWAPTGDGFGKSEILVLRVEYGDACT